MPLVRDGEQFQIAISGVKFWMTDIATNKPILCFVDHEALADRAAFDGEAANWVGSWRRHREFIESLASAHYDADVHRVDGMVTVPTTTLTPLSINQITSSQRRND
ncbi:MAG TPA: DUF1488 family protein [Xanthobacteraceae bacterium]|jgi:hypothetical protein